MAIRQDEVQLRVDFITDESQTLAKTLLVTKEYNQALEQSRAKIATYQKELSKLGTDEAKRAQILKKIADEENNVATNLKKIADEGRKVEALDMGKVAPAQLVERAKQLELAMKLIPQSAPQFKQLQTELAGVNTRLRELRNEARGIQEQGPAENGGGLLGSIMGRVAVVGAVIGSVFAAVRGVFGFVKDALKEFDEGAKADAALKSRIESTNGAAQRSFEELAAAAAELQKTTLFSDEQTKKGEEILLTFTNIRGEVLDETIPALLDLSTVFGQDVSASAVQLGKALNDPVKGITALQRVGITFSEEQKKLINSLVKTGDVAGAQKVILKELETQVGGAARAAAEAGQGPFQVLANRVGEIKESLGGLIASGLKPLLPVVKGVVTFFEGLTNAIVTGEKATGPFAGAINVVYFILKALGVSIQTVYQAWKVLIDNVYIPLGKLLVDTLVPAFEAVAGAVTAFIERGRQIPILSGLFQALGAAVQVFQDLFNDVPATFAGFVAAVRQAAVNVSGFFQQLILDAQILARQLQSALTISPTVKVQIASEINTLEARRAALASGKSVGDAYSEARNKALAEGRKQADAEAKAADEARKREAKAQKFSVGGGDPKEAAKLEKQALDLALKEVEADIARREVLLLNFRVQDEINEERYQQGLGALKRRELLAQLEVYRKFGQDQTKAALEIRKQLLEIQLSTSKIAPVQALPATGLPSSVQTTKDKTSQDLEVTDTGAQILQQGLRDKFTAALISEQEYNEKSLELKRDLIRQELAILRAAEQPNLDLIRKKEEAAAKIEFDLDKQRLENKQRTEELKRKVEAAGLDATKDVVSAAIELLARDEKARKKNASVIKAFQTGIVLVEGLTEVQKIWSHSADLGPIAGPIIAAVQTGAAVIRTIAAIGKINSAKFGGGGLLYAAQGMAKFGFFGGKPHSAGGTKGYFDDGTRIEVEKNEAFAVVNKKNAPMLRYLSAVNAFKGNGVPFFERGGRFDFGGLPALNTTPTVSIGAVQSAAAPAVENMANFVAAVVRFDQIVRGFPTEVRSRVVYTDIEDAGTGLNQVRDDAAL